MPRVLSQAEEDAIAARRARVAELRRKGRTMEEIAAEVECSIGTVHNDCKHLREQWRAKAAGDYNELMTESLEELENLKLMAKRSLAASVTEKRPDGSPAWSRQILRIQQAIDKLIGLEDPVVFQAKRVSESESAGGGPDIVELVVSSREEVEALRDEHGNISLAAYQQKMLGIAKQAKDGDSSEAG